MVDFTILDSRKFNGFIEEEQLVSYRVESNHLPVNHSRMFELKLEYHSPVYGDNALTKKDFIQKFSLKMGDEIFDENNLEVSEFNNGGEKNFKYKFRHEIKVEDTLDIEINAKIVKPLIDQSYSLYVRFPTKGYSARLSYKDSYNYVSNWFRYWDKSDDIMKSILDKKEFTNGITVNTREWVLPGEGVVLEFH